MAIGTQFSSLVIDLRAELRRSSDVSVGVDDNDSLKRTLNSVYTTLLAEHEWPHLDHTFDKIPMVAGDRLYDYPVGFDPDNIESAAVWMGTFNLPIRKGIDLSSYSFLDPATDQRSDPVLAWDVRFDKTSGISQIEIWPVPASASYSVQFKGVYAPPKLVNNSDPCLLDDELVLGFAAARLLASQGSKDAAIRLQQAEGYLLKKEQKPKTDAAPVQMGLGPGRIDRGRHPTVVIKPTGAI